MRVEIQRATGDYAGPLPSNAEIRRWAAAALGEAHADAELTVRIVDEAESRELNEGFRHKPGPTNVLSFPFDVPPGIELALLGDVVICAPIAAREAADQGKSVPAHWAHLVIHGVLHLLGYDHVDPGEADRMEALEITILEHLGYPNPYLVSETDD